MSDAEFSGTMAVAEEQRFDVPALERYLIEHVPGFRGPLQVRQFRGGQSNPTFLLRAADGAQYVLRKQPGGPLLPSAHAVDREFRVISALNGTGFPVARPVCLCEDRSVIGTLFYVMGYAAGRNFWDPTLPDLSAQERAAVYDEMNRVLVGLHTLDFARAGLADYGKPGQYVERQVARWTKQYRASQTEVIEAMDRLIEHLPRHIPPGEETSLVHGDYRLDNVIFHPREPRILAVIDWELSTLGAPLVELAYLAMRWRMPADGFRALGGLDLARLEIPGEAEFVADYCARRGREQVAPRVWAYYLAFNLFRLAAILQGVLARALQGNASSAHALEAGRRARAVAELGWRIGRESFEGG